MHDLFRTAVEGFDPIGAGGAGNEFTGLIMAWEVPGSREALKRLSSAGAEAEALEYGPRDGGRAVRAGLADACGRGAV